MELIYNSQIDKIIELALSEDIGSGDITTISTIPAQTGAHGRFIAKQDTVICGLEIAKKVFCIIDPATVFTAHFNDGDKVKTGDVLAVAAKDALSLPVHAPMDAEVVKVTDKAIVLKGLTK